MSSSTLRIVAILLAFGALVLGYVGYQTSHESLKPEGQIAEPTLVEPASYPILIAAKAIPPNQKITVEDIKVILVDKKITDSYTELESIIDLTSRMAISAGDMFLPEHFHSLGAITANLHPGERAVAIKVDEVTGVGGYIEPGDKVDVLLFLPASPETNKESSAQLLLTGLRVMAYGDKLDELDQQHIRQKSHAYLSTLESNVVSDMLSDSAKSEKSKNPSGKQSKTAVLAVNHELVSKLLLAESTGRLRLALVGGQTLTTDKIASDLSTENHHISLEALKGQPTETSVPIEKIESSSIKPIPKKPPAQITIHRGGQETVINLEQGRVR